MGPPRDDKAIAALYKATSHRTRRHILLVMGRDCRPFSAADYMRRFRSGDKKELSLVAYHFKILREAGLIELAKTQVVRGSIKSLYRPSQAFTAELRDTLALDKIAELSEEQDVKPTNELFKQIVEIVVATGRPIP